MSTIKYFNLYSLDFSHTNELMSAIEKNQDELGVRLRSALSGSTIKSQIDQFKGTEQTVNNAWRLDPDHKEMPGYKMFQALFSDIRKARTAAEEVLSNYSGTDPFEVQEIVHQILGISKNVQPQLSDKLRQEYLVLMKNTHFLASEYTSINQQDERPIHYQPSVLAAKLLEQHPEKKTMSIGCGTVGKTYPGSCHFRRAKDHIENLFTIDLSATQNPDLVVDMHDADFWDVIPKEHFEKIFDHTSGTFLLEDPQTENTLQQIYRTLKPGGYLEMDIPFKDKHKLLLRKIGFFVEEDETSKATKQ